MGCCCFLKWWISGRMHLWIHVVWLRIQMMVDISRWCIDLVHMILNIISLEGWQHGTECVDWLCHISNSIRVTVMKSMMIHLVVQGMQMMIRIMTIGCKAIWQIIIMGCVISWIAYDLMRHNLYVCCLGFNKLWIENTNSN